MRNLRLVPKPRPQANCRIVPLTPELFSLAAMGEQDELVATMAREPNVAVMALQPGLSFAVMDGGALICATGIFLAHFGKAQGWMLVTPLATKRHMAWVTRRAAEHFARWQENPAFRRIEIHVRADQPFRETFAKRLGMTEAWGPLKAWDPKGRDYWLYARVK